MQHGIVQQHGTEHTRHHDAHSVCSAIQHGNVSRSNNNSGNNNNTIL